MPSILIVTADPQSAERIAAIADSLRLRPRVVNKIDAAREWLGMEALAGLLIDSRWGNDAPIELARLAWSYKPHQMVGVFNFHGPIQNEWYLRLVGAQTFKGKEAYVEIETALKNIPRSKEGTTLSQIMLVEDLDSPRFIVSSYVEALGYGKVLGVSSVKEALGELVAQPQRFFCIITDLNMPEISGTDLIRLVRQDSSISHIPIVVLTSFGSAENLTECIKAGATGFLVKPPKRPALQLELEKAKRIITNHQSPCLCKPEDIALLDSLLGNLNIR